MVSSLVNICNSTRVLFFVDIGLLFNNQDTNIIADEGQQVSGACYLLCVQTPPGKSCSRSLSRRAV